MHVYIYVCVIGLKDTRDCILVQSDFGSNLEDGLIDFLPQTASHPRMPRDEELYKQEIQSLLDLKLIRPSKSY